MDRFEGPISLINVAIMFVPVFLAIFCSVLAIQWRKEARDRRIAEYRKSPDSRLLRLNY
jgi:hypothetical protein